MPKTKVGKTEAQLAAMLTAALGYLIQKNIEEQGLDLEDEIRSVVDKQIQSIVDDLLREIELPASLQPALRIHLTKMVREQVEEAVKEVL